MRFDADVMQRVGRLKSLEEIKEIFKDDKFATDRAGAQIVEVGEDYSKIKMEIQPHHLNARGQVMGGAIFTLADFAFAVASNAGGCPTVTVNSSISFLGAVKGKELIAEARSVKNGRSLAFYEVTISDELGSKVAFVSVSGMHV